MKNIYLKVLTLGFLLFSQCASQKNPKVTLDREDTFLLWLLKSRTEINVSKSPVKLNKGHLEILSTVIDFSRKDSLNMSLQSDANNKSSINSKLLPEKTFLDSFLIEEMIKRVNYSFLKISNPIYFENGKKVWIVVEQYCGDLCGSGEIQVYNIRDNNIYELIDKKRIWIS
jgi:hypothetical protein